MIKKFSPLIIGVLVGLLLGYTFLIWKPSHTVSPLNLPPTDSGFALVLSNERYAEIFFGYKFGTGDSTKYQIIYHEPKMDTIHWTSLKSGKDTSELMPHMGKDGRVEQVFTFPVIDSRLILAWFPKRFKK